MSNEIMLLEQCDSEDLGSRHNGKIIRQMITGALEELYVIKEQNDNMTA